MPTIAKPLYRALFRCLRTFAKSEVPVTGVVGLNSQTYKLNGHASLRQAFSPAHSQQSVEDGLLALRTLPRQLTALSISEEDTRQALASWFGLLRRLSQRDTTNASVLSEGIEEAALLVPQCLQQDVGFLSLDQDTGSDKDVRSAPDALDALAAKVAEHSGSSSVQNARERLQQMSEVLFQQQGFKYEPVEWVYEGVGPALLPHVLHTRCGVPLALAGVYGAVARRVGVPLVLLVAPGGGPHTTQEGPALVSQLPAELAARHAARTVAAPPAPEDVVLRYDAPPGEGDSAGPLFVDVSDSAGAVLELHAAQRRFPSIDLSAPLGGSLAVAAAAAMCRVMVSAHQRRGESDAVAHWLYQLLALDSAAGEWRVALQAALP